MSLPTNVAADEFNRLELTVTQDELENYPLMKRLTKHEQEEVVFFNVFVRPSNNITVMYITSDDNVYGMGENGYDVNILAMEGLHFRCDQVYRPIRVLGLSKKRIKAISIGGVIGAALDHDGALLWWGKDVTWKIDEIILPEEVGYRDTKFTTFSCGYAMLAAVDIKGQVYVWGPYDFNTNNYQYSHLIKFEQPVTNLSCGHSHLAVVSDGRAYTCGLGTLGQRGFSSYSPTVKNRDNKNEINLDEPCKFVACGPFSTFFVTISGKLWACGANCGQYGYLGVSSKEYIVNIPKQVALHRNVNYVLTSCDPIDYCTTLAFTDDGLYSWNGEGIGTPCKVDVEEAHFIASMCPKNVMIRVQHPSPPRPLPLSVVLLGKLDVASKLIKDLNLELEKLTVS
uniref:X-linked retinitis pigmentosa GTPase regulator n=1 Tax=Lygus hesperus TaxID=30085 RepID=A0A146L5M1_LYGHE